MLLKQVPSFLRTLRSECRVVVGNVLETRQYDDVRRKHPRTTSLAHRPIRSSLPETRRHVSDDSTNLPTPAAAHNSRVEGLMRIAIRPDQHLNHGAKNQVTERTRSKFLRNTTWDTRRHNHPVICSSNHRDPSLMAIHRLQ